MRLYRCTRNRPYMDPGSPGHHDNLKREPFFIEAENSLEAVREMERRFPEEKQIGFTAEPWTDA